MDEWVVTIILLVFAYLTGSLCFGLLLTRSVLRLDIREQGSGGVGATNVLRVAGRKLSLLTLLLDFAKGFLVVYGVRYFTDSQLVHAGCALLVVLGHVFPIYFKGRGGKGVATAAAALLPLMPVATGAAMLVWVGVFAWTRVSSVASLSATLALLIGAWWADIVAAYALAATVIALVVVIRHWHNLVRLRRGEEHSINL